MTPFFQPAVIEPALRDGAPERVEAGRVSPRCPRQTAQVVRDFSRHDLVGRGSARTSRAVACSKAKIFLRVTFLPTKVADYSALPTQVPPLLEKVCALLPQVAALVLPLPALPAQVRPLFREVCALLPQVTALVSPLPALLAQVRPLLGEVCALLPQVAPSLPPERLSLAARTPFATARPPRCRPKGSRCQRELPRSRASD